jgi:hypothetical protein
MRSRSELQYVPHEQQHRQGASGLRFTGGASLSTVLALLRASEEFAGDVMLSG